jgi:hypothetical protein
MSLEERFWSKVEVTGHRGSCWLWTGNTRKGYGRIWGGGRLQSAHRTAYELTVGKIPNDMLVCHTCDNPACVNPEHLFLGTKSDNAFDSVNKGRWCIENGEACQFSKLTWVQVTEIRRLSDTGLSQRAIAKRFDVTQANVWSILHDKTWQQN